MDHKRPPWLLFLIVAAVALVVGLLLGRWLAESPEWRSAALDGLTTHLSPRRLLDIGHQPALLVVLLLLLLVLLFIPVALYLTRGWVNRKADIVSSISPRAAMLYLRNFQAENQTKRDDLDTRLTRTDHLEAALDTAAQWRAARDRLNQLQAVNPPDPAAVAAQQAEMARLLAQMPPNLRNFHDQPDELLAEVRKLTKDDYTRAENEFADFYTGRFGRLRFFWPVALLLVLAGFLLSFPRAEGECAWDRIVCPPPAAGAAVEPAAATKSYDWGWIIGFAILGGYTRVVYELVLRYYQDNIRPADLFWWCYRLVISVPLGYAVAILLAGTDNARTAYACAFLLGLFPTTTVTNLGRRLFAKWTQTPEVDTDTPAQLKEVPSLDPTTTLLLTEEGITTFAELAYADPIRLSIRTGLGFSFVVTCVSEALLLGYLTTRARMDIARRFGVAGAYEAANLWDDAQKPPGTPARTQADAIIGQMFTPLETTEAGLRNILAQVAGDPYTQFVRECWASNFTDH